MTKIPRLVIAGTNSGCGKTTITTGIMASLVKRGKNVQPFKVGPDYIDPMFHTFVTGRHSRNLDSWMIQEDTVNHLFVKNSKDADISVVEGVMGFYDGFGGYSTTGSTAHVSKIIKAPVILVVNGEGTSVSIAALVKGFKEFERDVDVKGVIVNNIKSHGHYQLLKEVIEDYTGVKAIGYLLKNEGFGLTSRHLGLVPSGEIEGLKGKIDLLAGEVEKTVDLDLLMELANEADDIQDNLPIVIKIKPEKSSDRPRIAVAMDKAFNFYYKDNLDLLEELGSELVYFSPLEDRKLPENIDGLYFGGGYPEVYAKDLQENVSMKEDIKRTIESGMPTYAECGGFMYMTDSIKDKAGNEFEMLGVIPGKSEMTSSLKRFGYVELEINGGSVLAKDSKKVKAHEFHYSETYVGENITSCYTVVKPKRSGKNLSWDCGYRKHNLLAGYPHIHFWSNPKLAEEFVESCRDYKAKTKG